MIELEDVEIYFYRFRPSDRLELKAVTEIAGGGKLVEDAFLNYLDEWAQGHWIDEYTIEHICKWFTIHLQLIAVGIRERALDKFCSARTEQEKAVYSIVAETLRDTLPTIAQPIV